jgi:hypothetical protein
MGQLLARCTSVGIALAKLQEWKRLGGEIRSTRIRFGVKIAAVAQHSGIPLRDLIAIENGTHGIDEVLDGGPSDLELKAVALALDLDEHQWLARAAAIRSAT